MRPGEGGLLWGESLSCHAYLCRKPSLWPSGDPSEHRPDCGGRDGGSGRFCEVSELTWLGNGTQKAGFPAVGRPGP